MGKYHTKKELTEDVYRIQREGQQRGYIFSPSDWFAWGYMCAKYGLDRLVDNKEALIKACEEYDEADDLGIYDTIKEVFMDLEMIPREN